MKSILVVEDEEQLAQVISSYLGTLKYEVTGIVDSGEKALELISQRRISLALLDINIHGAMDGFGVAEVLRRQHDIPSIFLTGQSDEETLQSVLDSSAYGYLLKPFRPEELKAAIEFALVRHAQESRWKRMEQSYSAAVQSTGDGVIITDADARVLFMNPAAQRMAGWVGRLARGERLTEVLSLPAGDGALTRLWQAAFGGEDMREEIQIGRTGSTQRVDVSLARVQDSARGPQGVVLVMRDNTEHFRNQEELRRAQSQIRTLTEQLHATSVQGGDQPQKS